MAVNRLKAMLYDSWQIAMAMFEFHGLKSGHDELDLFHASFSLAFL